MHITIFELILMVTLTAAITVWLTVAYQLRTDTNEVEVKLDNMAGDLFHLTRLINWHCGLTTDEELESRWKSAVEGEMLPHVYDDGTFDPELLRTELHLVQPNVDVVDAQLLVPYYGD